MDFPLKSDFFPQVRLSNDEKTKYLRTVEASAVALRRSLAPHGSDWKKLYDREGITFSKAHFVREEPSYGPPFARTGAATACLAVCATIYTSGTISEVLEAIASPVTEDYRKAMKFIYKSRFIDGLGLHTIVPSGGSATSQNSQAFTTIKWAAFDDGKVHNSPKFPVGSDYCFLEHSGIQRDESEVDDQHHGDNNESSDDIFGFSIQESIVREREVPSLAGFGLRRGEFHRTGIIILPTERRDVVQISSILQMSLLGSDSAGNKAALERLMLKRVEAVGLIDVLLERRRLSKMQFIHRDEWVADEDRKSCAVCVKPFSIRRRHHCRNCGEVVCSACAPPREVDVSNFGSALIRICTACVVAARSEPQQLQSGNQDVFVYHIRSTLSSRTSTNSSNLTNDGEDKASGTSGAMASGNVRPHSFSSDDSNFSIASEYPQQQQQSIAAAAQVHHHHHPMYQHHDIATNNNNSSSNNNDRSIANEFFDEDDDDNFDDYYIRDSQSSCDSSSYSFSDLNTFDDRFGSAIMKRLAAPMMPTQQRTSTSSYSTNKNNGSNSNYGRESTQRSSSSSKHVLCQAANAQSRAPAYRHERLMYNPSKVVTHLLSNNNQEDNDDDEEETKEPEVQAKSEPHDKRSSVDSLGSLGEFQDCIRGLQENIFRVPTTTRFSDLKSAADSFSSDLPSFHRDLLASSGSTNPLTNSAAVAAKAAAVVSPPPPSASSPIPRPRSPPRPQRSASICSRPSTVDVDIDMLTSDSFSLICPDLLQIQRRSSSVKQDAGEIRRSRVLSLLRCSNNSVFDEDHDNNGGQQQQQKYDEEEYGKEEEEEEEEEDSQNRDDLEALRLQVQGLHRSLEDATSKLNYYQSRTEATRARRTPSAGRRSSGRSNNRYRRGSVQSTASNVSNTSNTSSSSSGGSSQRSRNNDPVLAKRTESYDALVSELHEIMGLPTLSPRRTITSARGF